MAKQGKISNIEKNLKLFLKKAKVRVKKVSDVLLDGLFPEGLTCMVCGKELNDLTHRHICICPACEKELPFRHKDVCERCGKNMDEGSEEKRCAACGIAEPSFDKIYSMFDYSGSVKKLLIEYKKEERYEFEIYFARFILDYLKSLAIETDYILCVPTLKTKVFGKDLHSFKNVVDIVAKESGRVIITPLLKVKQTNQKFSTQEERVANVKDAYLMDEKFDKDILEEKTIMIIDDVATTGSTINECARVLKENGAGKVYGVTLARS